MEKTEARKLEMQELEEACKPVVEFLKKKHPHYSVTVDTEIIKLNEAVIGVQLND